MPSKPYGNIVGDPDARSVWRPLCEPLALRWWQGGESGSDEAPYPYRFPVGASIVQRYEDPYASIVVERCGRPRPLLVHRCAGDCDPPLIGAGVVAWRDGDRVRAFLPRTRRRVTWALPDHRFVLTAHRIWVVRDGRLHTARV